VTSEKNQVLWSLFVNNENFLEDEQMQVPNEKIENKEKRRPSVCFGTKTKLLLIIIVSTGNKRCKINILL
jgi:hypothetical protein